MTALNYTSTAGDPPFERALATAADGLTLIRRP
jgi:hypothetical protein